MGELITNMMSSRLKINYDSLFENPDMDDSGDEMNQPPEPTYTREQVEELLEESRREWLQQHEAALEEAKKASYREGFVQGQQKGGEKIKESSQTVLKAFEEIESRVRELMAQVKPQIATVIFDIAEKILELPVESEQMHQRVVYQIDQVIDEIGDNLDIRIEVSTGDYERIKEMLDNREESNHISLFSVAHLNPGEFRVDTNQEQIVQQFRKSLNDFRESLSFNEPAHQPEEDR